MPTAVAGVRDIVSSVARHDEWRLRKCINLQCSENVTSEAVRRILSSDMGHRYTLPISQEVHGSFVGNAYRGTKYMDEVERQGEEIAKEIFGGEFASLKPLSGHIAAMIMLVATCKRGDKILVIDGKHGGYDGYLKDGMPDMFGFKVDFLPFDEKRWNVDSERAAGKIADYKPKLIVLGASFLLFPYDIRPIRTAADDVGALIGYDGSHVLGLISGGIFQKPLQEGADILVGSTHKSFFGPQGGLFLCGDKRLSEAAQKAFYWRVMDNAHWNRVAALAQALAEAKRFGRDYAKQVVRNSKALAGELDRRGLPIKFPKQGYTECHQIHVDETRLKDSWGLTFSEFADRLEKCGIIVDAVGRIGTNEMTRLGAKEIEMRKVAGLLIECLNGGEISGEVALMKSRSRMSFCFDRS